MEDVITLISKTTDAWNMFRESDTSHFSDLAFTPVRPGSSSILLLNIDSYIKDLGNMCRDIQDQKQRLETLERQVSTAIMLALTTCFPPPPLEQIPMFKYIIVFR